MRNLRKFGWIEACFRYGGTFGSFEKAVYRAVFEVSEPSMSRHQEAFMLAVNAFCEEDVFEIVKGKIAFTERGVLPVKPIFHLPSITLWLTDVMGDRFERVKAVTRSVPNHSILRSCVQAIRTRQVMQVAYVSKAGKHTPPRNLSMHVLVEIVGRFHVRCYDHSKNRYGDFIISHMLTCTPDQSGAVFVSASADTEWATKEKVIILASEGPSRAAAIIDYGLGHEGSRVVKLRSAFVDYFVDDMAEGYENSVSVRIMPKELD
jgi:hypothetical protein